MPGYRIVPTLAALVLAGGLAASDGVAPVITLLDTDIQPTVPTVNETETDPAALLNGDDLLADLYLYNANASGSPWEDVLSNTVPIRVEAAGIAIVGADGGGTWQYNVDGNGWQNIAAVSEDNALLLSLMTVGYSSTLVASHTTLRFVPDPANFTRGDTTVALTFRVWDGTGRQDPGNTSQLLARDTSGSYVSTQNVDPHAPQYYGGSPSPFSAETRTIRVQVHADNVAPVIDDSSHNIANGIYAHIGVPVDIASLVTVYDEDDILLNWSASSSNYGTISGSTYTPNPLYAGQSELITFTIDDDHGGSDSISVPITLVNDPPAISVVSGLESWEGYGFEVGVGGQHSFTLRAEDLNGDALTWDFYNDGETTRDPQHAVNGLARIDNGDGTFTFTYVHDGDTQDSSDSFVLTLDDGYNTPTELWVYVNVVDNTAPVITTVIDADIEVYQGGSVTFTVNATDAEGDTLTWGNDGEFGPQYGDLTLNDDGEGTATVTYEAGPYGSTDSVLLYVNDGNGGQSTITVNFAILPNQAPFVANDSLPGLAVVGQPYEALVTVRDEDSDLVLGLSIAATGYSALPADLTVAPNTASLYDDGEVTYGQRSFLVRFVPTATGTLTLRAIPVDSHDAVGTPLEFPIVVGDPAVATVTEPTIPVSTPGNPIYAAIAPGSTAGFDSLLTALAPSGPDVARAWWWQTAGAQFYDAESSPVPTAKHPSAAVFLASTVALSFSFDSKPYPMPFAIDLPPANAQATGAGSDGWTFFGVPPLWDGEGTLTSHDLSDFALQTADGMPVNNPYEIADALAPYGSLTPQQPWGRDTVSNGYVAASTLVTGQGYWIRNRSTTHYRLVRVASTDERSRIDWTFTEQQQTGAVAAKAAAAAVSAADQPPAPPSGTASEPSTASSSSDGCGASSLAGLLMAGLALVGLRTRRRN